ncbi:MAG: 16S rRNA (cytosine(1402)-N(4))-methyltransferase RsmH [Patescibacteria group bacterium]|nr:16S rRNA (cytosine(1402)-N(4))-methyltransferase RsmH [Patescibacteria group bacterium]
MHTPVLLHEVLDGLRLRPGERVLDGTLNGGGHAREILRRLGGRGAFVGVDLDESLLRRTAAELESEFRSPDLRLEWVRGNYADAKGILAERGMAQADAALLDLGFSSVQLESGRGFSFLRDEPLLMTYDEGETPLSESLRRLTEEELVKLIGGWGEERFAGRIARAIRERERKSPIKTTGELRDAVVSAVPPRFRHGRLDPATRTFQALRMYANDEPGNLERFLAGAPEMLAAGGRLAVISFHSLEDRLVKRAFREWEARGIGEASKKPVAASRAEIQANPRSRSAKLRLFEKNKNSKNTKDSK